MTYEYDAEDGVLIRIPDSDLPMVIEKDDLHWKDLGPEYELYARAIYLGQGCWERLETITEEQAQQVLDEWGYDDSIKSVLLVIDMQNDYLWEKRKKQFFYNTSLLVSNVNYLIRRYNSQDVVYIRHIIHAKRSLKHLAYNPDLHSKKEKGKLFKS